MLKAQSLGLLLAVTLSAVGLASALPPYTAAVMEFVFSTQPNGPFDRAAAVAYMNTNLDLLEGMVQNATSGAARAQIIVFPEYGIVGWPGAGAWTRDSILPFLEPIPNAAASSLAAAVNPCQTANPLTPITNRLSCLARNYQITIVADYGDLQTCTPGNASSRLL
jgi:hypothetical protein